MTHQQLVNLMLGRLQALLGEDCAWQVNVGSARRVREDGSVTRPYLFGVVGSADVSGIMPRGRRLEIECKTGDATLNKEQRKFLAKINRAGGLGLESRDTTWAMVVDQVQREAGL